MSCPSERLGESRVFTELQGEAAVSDDSGLLAERCQRESLGILNMGVEATWLLGLGILEDE